jgi:hypothetical protein
MSGDVLGYEPRNLGDLVGRERRDCNPYHLQLCAELAAKVDRTRRQVKDRFSTPLAATLLSRALQKECLNLPFKGIFVHHACVRLGDLPVAANEQRHRERGEPAVSDG